ncbi:alanine dehydrogenase [Rapidithrix thailandica]|uniref:alanine dehydrogenase n=1 Tax=Rapidithrix thailandica TaxID=413964 RepID=A0AAW9S0X5_9BACT
MGNKKKGSFSEVAEEFYQYHPQETLEKEQGKHKNPISIGIPNELERYEKRLVLRPEAVAILVNNGYDVRVESGAGNSAKYTDREFSEAGAKIVYSAKEAFEVDIVLKISPPTLKEINYMKKGKTVFSALQLNTLPLEYIEALLDKDITALAFELIEDKVGGLPVVRAMSEIAGSTVMLIAAEQLSSLNEGKGIIMGGITGVPPTKVVVLGAGTVAEFAVRTAIGLGAEVMVFDNHIYKLRRLKESLGLHQLYTSTIDMLTLEEALADCDVAIGAIRAEEGVTPCVVTEEMVAKMKPDSVIIDVSIDQGGCFDTSECTTHVQPTYRKHGVIHYCVPNMASRVSRTATSAISNIFTPILSQIIELGGIDKMIFQNSWFAHGIYTYRRGVTNKLLANKFKLPFKDLELIIAASTSIGR